MTGRRIRWKAYIMALPAGGYTWVDVASGTFRWRWAARLWMKWQTWRMDPELAFEMWGTLLKGFIIGVDPATGCNEEYY